MRNVDPTTKGVRHAAAALLSSGRGNDFNVPGARLTISPDGMSVYQVSTGAPGLFVFHRNVSDGLIHASAVYRPDPNVPTATLDDLPNPRDVATSPDGMNVYVVGNQAQTGQGGDIVVMSRDMATGKLTPLASYKQSDAGFSVLDDPRALAISADGRFLYTANANSRTVAVFARATAAFDGTAEGLRCVTAATAVTCAVDQLSVNQLPSATVTVVSPASDGSFLAQTEVAATSPNDAGTVNNHAEVAVTVKSPVAAVPPNTDPAPVVVPPASSDAGATRPTDNPPAADNNNAVPDLTAGTPTGSDVATGNQETNNPAPSGDSSAAPRDSNNVAAPADSGDGSGGGGAFGLTAPWLLLGRELSRRRTIKLAHIRVV